MESEDFKNVFLTVLTERIVWKTGNRLERYCCTKVGWVETTS